MVDPTYAGISQNNAIRIPQSELESLEPTDMRIFAIFKSLMMGTPIDEVHEKTRVDRWFLYKLENIVKIERELLNCSRSPLTPNLLIKAKKAGYSDRQIAKILRINPKILRQKRTSMKIFPAIKQIDTLGAEYPAQTNYLYSSYHGQFNDLEPAAEGRSIIVLGSGAYKIGSSVEFDWCCVTAIKTFRELKIPTILINKIGRAHV